MAGGSAITVNKFLAEGSERIRYFMIDKASKEFKERSKNDLA